jgi:hypothetical protein
MPVRAISTAVVLTLCCAGAWEIPSTFAADGSPKVVVAKIEQLSGKIGLDTAGRVVKVDLMDIEISDADVRLVATLPDLQWLRLWGADITNEGIKHLAGLKALKTLNLRQTDIDDGGLEHLKSLTGLEELTLSVTAVSDEGVARLQAALPKCRIVK